MSAADDDVKRTLVEAGYSVRQHRGHGGLLWYWESPVGRETHIRTEAAAWISAGQAFARELDRLEQLLPLVRRAGPSS